MLTLTSYLVSNLLVYGYRRVIGKSLSSPTLMRLTVLAALLITVTVYAKQSGSFRPLKNETNTVQNTTQPAQGLHMSVIKNDIESVEKHIALGSDLNIIEPSGGSSPLITAALLGKTEIAILLIDAGADVNFQNYDGSTALHTASFFCHISIVEYLLENGADAAIRNNSGSTAYESVAAPFEYVQPVYEYFANTLGPIGLQVDYDELKEMRPQIAALLQEVK